MLKSRIITTPIGTMLAIASDTALIELKFTTTEHQVTQDASHILDSAEQELSAYFAGTLKKFTTPLALVGTEFQNKTWKALQTIPYGKTKSYAQLANTINKPMAHRAVGNANGKNNIAIIIPCHRVIASSGALGGYNGGIDRKQWLLNHESKNRTKL